MPYAPPLTAPILTSNLMSVGFIGTSLPKYAMGIANGLAQWLPQVTVSTTDVGSTGVGVGILPLILPQPVLYAQLMASFSSLGLLGILSPIHIAGLSNGISVALLSALVMTQHTPVGTGTGICSISAPPATSSMQSGFAQAGMTGSDIPKISQALGVGLQQAIMSLVFPIPIVGSVSPSASVGTGTGKII